MNPTSIKNILRELRANQDIFPQWVSYFIYLFIFIFNLLIFIIYLFLFLI